MAGSRSSIGQPGTNLENKNSNTKMDSKRAKTTDYSLVEPFTMHQAYPIYIQDNAKDDLCVATSNVLPQSSEKPFILVKAKAGTRFFLEAVEKGNENLELLLTLNRDCSFVMLNSPAIHIESSEPIFYDFCDGRRIDCETIRDLEVQALSDEFSETSILSIENIFKTDYYKSLYERIALAGSIITGPPDFCRLGFVDSSSLSPHIMFLWSADFIKKLESITGLDLALPLNQPRVLKLERGSYLLLNEDRGDRLVEGLDVLFCFCSDSMTGSEHGSIRYISKEDGEVVATLCPAPNRMLLAYRSEGAMRFIRYIPKSSDATTAYYVSLTYPIRP